MIKYLIIYFNTLFLIVSRFFILHNEYKANRPEEAHNHDNKKSPSKDHIFASNGRSGRQNNFNIQIIIRKVGRIIPRKRKSIISFF